MKTWHIHILGQVQGVGFRPFVYKKALEYGLSGWVNNTVDGVHIEFNAAPSKAQHFYQALIQQAPSLSKITKHSIQEIAYQFFDNFQIIHSDSSGTLQLLLTPDFALCEACRKELRKKNDRRKDYPFITCTECGPRFSLIQSLPYDRERTSMQPFQMCKYCQGEYNHPLDRRYFSQTNSCENCGVQLTLFQQEKTINETDEIIHAVVDLWTKGKIVAIKGIGGYLLTCDANHPEAIQNLRIRKHRPSKPFAVMFPSKNDVENACKVRKIELDELSQFVSPIVLLDVSDKVEQHIKLELIAPGLNQLGVMLPYAPLYELLLQAFQKPIIATSGNISHAPIVYQDEKALADLGQIADAVLVNNRDIIVPQDDSVVRYTPQKQQKIILRRSRGLAPTYINSALKVGLTSRLAMGAMLKSTFSLSHQGNIYISQYLGDLENYETQAHYKHTLKHFFQLFDAKPEVIICDSHPLYPSSQYGTDLSQELGVPLISVQHHIAHFGAVLGENNLLSTDEPVLGVIWDGTGLGDDGQIWGGEFFLYENRRFQRVKHFEYFDFILGDKMPREPRISALSACWGISGIDKILAPKFTKVEWNIYAKLLQKENPLQTSSLGRIYDAVASLLGIMDVQSFEGEAAMRIEALAMSYFSKHGLEFSEDYASTVCKDGKILTKELMKAIIDDITQEKNAAFIAAKFHFSLGRIIKSVANNLNIQKIAFSGGVFQNSLLVDLIIHHLDKDFDLYFHRQLSPNDENISFGQIIVQSLLFSV